MSKLHITVVGHRQDGEERTAVLTCSCGLKYEANLRKEKLRSAHAKLDELHTKKPEAPKTKKKSKKAKTHTDSTSESKVLPDPETTTSSDDVNFTLEADVELDSHTDEKEDEPND